LGLTDQVLPAVAATMVCCGAVKRSAAPSASFHRICAARRSVAHLQAGRQVVPARRELRRRWPTAGRVALLHRTGAVALAESSVLAVVSAPHRPEAFEAARYAIDALKAAAPIWKHEVWSGGAEWGTGASLPVAPASVGGRS
jgi:molybdopterin synthase catalytic subunit